MLCLLQWMRVKKNLQLVQHLTMSAARKDSPLARITLARVTPLSVVLPVKSGQIQRGGLSSGTTTTVETPMGNQGVFLASQRTQMLNTVQSLFVQKSRSWTFLLTMRDQVEGIAMEVTHTPLWRSPTCLFHSPSVPPLWWSRGRQYTLRLTSTHCLMTSTIHGSHFSYFHLLAIQNSPSLFLVQSSPLIPSSWCLPFIGWELVSPLTPTHPWLGW